MTAVGSDNEPRPDHLLLTGRSCGSHSDHAVFLSHECGHSRLVTNLDTCRRCRILQETVEPPSARTVLSSVTGKLDVDEGVVLSQPHDARRRCLRADCLANTDVVEDVEAWRMDSVGRQDLIAR